MANLTVSCQQDNHLFG